jgi:hypothetical protein
MWAGFVLAPILTLIAALLFVRIRFGKDNFPFLLKDIDSEIEVLDDTLTTQSTDRISGEVKDMLLSRSYSKDLAYRAALFVEEICLTVLDKNKNRKKPVLIEYSIFFESDSVLIIERDSGELFDLTDPDMPVDGLSSLIISGLMESQKEKAYLVTTGYNRNMIRLSNAETGGEI